MANPTRSDRTEGVAFYSESDGSVTARDLETGLARGGATRAKALAQLAEVLKLHEGSSEPIVDPTEFLETEFDLDADALEITDENSR